MSLQRSGLVFGLTWAADRADDHFFNRLLPSARSVNRVISKGRDPY